jgi:hypothetical protein
VASVYQCATCGEWMSGAAWFRKDAPTDPDGRIDRDYADSKPPKFCSESCRDAGEE